MNNSQQLMSLIKNKAKQINISTQILLNRYFMERFLELIANSKYKENFILKGGVLISTLVGVDKRTTNDMDFAFKNKSISVTEITNLLNDVIDDMFTITKIEHIRENQDSFGLRVFFNAQFENIKTIIHIDIVKYEEIIPSERLFGYPLLLEDRSIGIYCYEVETVVAEKLQAILSRGIISSRMRDYYDCYMLERMYGGEINTKKLKSAIAYTTLPTNTSEVLTSVSKSEQMAQMWERYQKTNSYEAKINFIETIESVRSLLKIAEVLK